MAKYLKKFETVSEYNAYMADEPLLPNVSFIDEIGAVNFNRPVPPPHDYSQDYLTFVFSTTGSVSSDVDGIYFSNDSGETWNAGTISVSTPGSRILAKGDANIAEASSGVFSCEGEYSVEGNIMSIYDSEGFRTRTSFDNNSDALWFVFAECDGLTSAENLILPATTLTENCYANMFDNCVNLTVAPELPATTLAMACYSSMFKGCTSLTTAPELPATTLGNGCYVNMFEDCTSLTTAQELPATTLTENCYSEMFKGCTSLTTAPELPATTLVKGCYNNMFENCESLNYIKCLATSKPRFETCTGKWVLGVANTGTFVKASGADWETGDDGIPSGWTVQDAS